MNPESENPMPKTKPELAVQLCHTLQFSRAEMLRMRRRAHRAGFPSVEWYLYHQLLGGAPAPRKRHRRRTP